MPGKILGLDITDDSITAVQVTSTLKGYQVTACAHITFDEENGLERALSDLFERTEFKSDICNTSIPTEYASFRNLLLPFKDPKKIRQTLAFELEPMLPFPIGDLVVDFSLIQQTNQSHILAAALKKDVISGYLVHLRTHKVDPDCLDIRCMPVISQILNQEITPDNGLFLQLDGKKIAMVLFLDKRIALIRTLYLKTEPTDVHTVPIDINTALAPSSEAVEQYYTHLCNQVQNTIHSFCTKNNTVVQLEKVFIAGKNANVSGSPEIITRLMEIPAEQIDLIKNGKVHIDEKIAPNWNPSIMGNALALAIRDTKKDQGFNFRRNGFDKKKHYLGPKKEIRRSAVLLIILLFFLGGNVGVDYYHLDKKNEELSSNISEIFTETFPDMTKIPRDQELNIMIGQINRIKKAGFSSLSGSKSSVLDLLKNISERIPQTFDVQLIRMVVDVNTVRLSGTTDTYNTVDKIKNDLEASEYFKTATISSSKLDRTGEKVEFEIKLDRDI